LALPPTCVGHKIDVLVDVQMQLAGAAMLPGFE